MELSRYFSKLIGKTDSNNNISRSTVTAIHDYDFDDPETNSNFTNTISTKIWEQDNLEQVVGGTEKHEKSATYHDVVKIEIPSSLRYYNSHPTGQHDNFVVHKDEKQEKSATYHDVVKIEIPSSLRYYNSHPTGQRTDNSIPEKEKINEINNSYERQAETSSYEFSIVPITSTELNLKPVITPEDNKQIKIDINTDSTPKLESDLNHALDDKFVPITNFMRINKEDKKIINLENLQTTIEEIRKRMAVTNDKSDSNILAKDERSTSADDYTRRFQHNDDYIFSIGAVTINIEAPPPDQPTNKVLPVDSIKGKPGPILPPPNGNTQFHNGIQQSNYHSRLSRHYIRVR